MASIYVTTNSYLDQVSYTASDQIVVNAGVTCTVRQTNATVPQGFVVYGTLLVDAYASGATTPIIFTPGGVNANPINVGNAGKFTVRGGWHQVGTGNGNDSQTFTDFVNGWIPYAQVETGNGTNTYVDCICTPFAFNTHGPSTSNDLGNVFQKSGTTITFGASGTGGIKPASGARVRVPNIHITITGVTAKTNTTSQRHMDFENCSFGRYVAWDISGGNNLPYGRFVNVGMAKLTLTSCTNFICDGLIIQSPDNSQSTLYGISSPTGSIKRLMHLHVGSATGLLTNSATSNVTFEKCAFYNNARTSTSRDLTAPNGWIGVTFKECIFAGARLNINTCTNITLKDCKFSDMLTGVQSSTNATEHIYTNQCRYLTIDGVTLAQNGCAARNYGINSNYDFYLTVKNWNIDCNSQMLSPVILNQSEGDLNFYNFTCGTTRGGGYYIAFGVGTKYRIVMKNIRGTYFQNISAVVAGMQMLGYSASGFTAAVTNIDQEMAVFYQDSTSAASIIFTISPVSGGGYFTAVTGNPSYDYSTGIVCKTNDQFIITPRDKIYTISGFVNSDPSSSFTTEYSLSTDGATWSNWTALTGANLSAETVSATDGFYIRLRVTADYDGAWTGTTISATYNPATYFPVAFVDLKLDNVVSGSTWRISKTSDNSTIASGTASGTTVTAPIVYSSDTPVTIRVRKAGYVPFETGGTITSTGMTTWVSQVTDTVYQA